MKTPITLNLKRNILIKKGYKSLVDKFEGLDKSFKQAFASKLITPEQIRLGQAPLEYLEMSREMEKIGDLLDSYSNTAIREIQTLEKDPDAILERYTKETVNNEQPNAPLSTKDRYMQNPNRENGFVMVKESLGLKANMLDDNQVYRHEKEQQENVDRTLALIADQQAKEFAAAEKRQREKEEDFRKHGNQLDAAAREVMNDVRLRPVTITPNNQSMEKLVARAKSYTEGYE